jgi:hypothetical protein
MYQSQLIKYTVDESGLVMRHTFKKPNIYTKKAIQIIELHKYSMISLKDK